MLCVVLYVDVGDNRPFLDQLPYSFVSDYSIIVIILKHIVYVKVLKDMKEKAFESTTGKGGEVVALTKVRNDNFPDVKEWIEDFFEHELLVSYDISSNPYLCIILLQVHIQHLSVDQQDKNLLIAQVFHLLALLVSFGYYDDDDDVKKLLPKVISCLDGRKDRLTQRKPKSEKSMSSINASNIYTIMQH